MATIWHSMPGAGHTIIEDRYSRLAVKRRQLQALNNVAVGLNLAFLTLQWAAEYTRYGSVAPTSMALLAAGLEAATWLLFLAGLGFGRASDERVWLLRFTTFLLAASAAGLHMYTLAHQATAIQGVVQQLTAGKGIQDPAQLASWLTKAGAVAARFGTIAICAAYLKDKSAAAKRKRP